MDTDRNLLFGVLALQAAFLDNNQFAEACAAWTTRKQTPLAELLVERGWLQPQERDEVERLVERHLKRHGGDVKKSLGAVADGGIRDIVRDQGDEELRKSLSSLPPAAGYVLVSTVAPTIEHRTRYSLSRLHGEGGLGRVYVAHDNDLNRDVALKEIKPDQAAHPEAWRRFLKEAQITGQLEHPHIVPVYEAARRTEDDQPFYTMRLVKGQTLRETATDYHRRRKEGKVDPLELPRLLQTFVSVCQAIGYAHSRGVIHRDLKPDNVVVGGFGEVVVLDWGLAKMVDKPEEDAAPVAVTDDAQTAATLAGRTLGAPAYMAPEQAEGRTDLFDARTDIYGLGAVLFEILTGSPPHDGNDTAEVLRQIIHGDTPRVRRRAPGVPAALDAICAEAMAKDRHERYAKASDVADDVQRYLADQPVSCYGEPVLIQVARWGRKHKPLVATAAAVLVTATVGLGIGLAAVEYERRQTASERDRKDQALQAETKARTLAMNALRNLTDDVVERQMASKLQLTDEDRRFLRGIQRQYEEFAALPGDDAEQRAIRAEGHYRVALVGQGLGDEKVAEGGYREAQGLYEQLSADFPTRPEFRRALARNHGNLGNVLCTTGRHGEAETAYAEALAIQKQLAAEFPARPELRRELAGCYYNLGVLLYNTGRLKEAETAYTEALAIRKQLLADFLTRPEFRQELARSHNSLGALLRATGRLKEAESAFADALAIQKQLAADFPTRPEFRQELATGHNNLGAAIRATGRPKEAETAFADALAIQKQLAADFPTRPQFRQELARSHNNLGILLSTTGRLKDAETAFADALAIQKQLANDFPLRPEFRQELAGSHNNLGNLLSDTGRLKAAETAYTDAVAIQKQMAADFPSRPDFRQDLARSHNNLGDLLSDTGRLNEAETAYADALAIRKQLAADFPRVLDYQTDLAGTLVNGAILANRRRDFAAARRMLEEALPHHQAALGASPGNPTYRKFYRTNLLVLIQSCAGGNAQAAAVQAAEKLRDLGWDPAGNAYDATCGLALCIHIVEKDDKASDEERAKRVQFYGDQSVTMLRTAVAKGYKNAAHMKRDKDLDALRDRDDFKKLLAELEAKAKEASNK